MGVKVLSAIVPLSPTRALNGSSSMSNYLTYFLKFDRYCDRNNISNNDQEIVQHISLEQPHSNIWKQNNVKWEG